MQVLALVDGEIREVEVQGGQTVFLNVNGGDSSTVFEEYVLRLDFGSSNGSTINPDGVV